MFLIKEEDFVLDLRGYKKIKFSISLSEMFDFYCSCDRLPNLSYDKRVLLSRQFGHDGRDISYNLYKLTNKKLFLFKTVGFYVPAVIFRTLEMDVLFSHKNLALVKNLEVPTIYAICFRDNKILLSQSLDNYGSILCQSL